VARKSRRLRGVEVLRNLLEALRLAIHNEESERREGEDWSIAKEYVRSLLQQTKSDDAAE
jgi:hypothetical protein